MQRGYWVAAFSEEAYEENGELYVDELFTRSLIKAIFYFIVWSCKYDGADLIKRR